MHKTFLFILLFLLSTIARAQHLVFTSDIDHFWITYDSVRTTTDSVQQVRYVQRLYIDPGTPGLKAFMKARNYDAPLWVHCMRAYPAFWASIRPHTLAIKDKTRQIEAAIDRFKKIYPDMRPSTMYFTIGCFRSGGTTSGNMVLVGAEIATADSTVDASELTPRFQTVFRHQNASNIVAVNVHEYVHTQQVESDGSILLATSIKEGAAEFIEELASGITDNTSYMVYGREHEAGLKADFATDMYGTSTNRWLYNGNEAHPDLGYYMGYAICSAYFNKTPDKTQAIKDIIRLNIESDSAVDQFLDKSGYFPQRPDKASLLEEYNSRIPEITGFSPDIHQLTVADTTLTFVFSQPMRDGFSINLGPGGEASYPFTGVIGYGADHKSFTVKMALKPAHHYDFVITGKSFISQRGYPLKEFPVDFTTK